MNGYACTKSLHGTSTRFVLITTPTNSVIGNFYPPFWDAPHVCVLGSLALPTAEKSLRTTESLWQHANLPTCEPTHDVHIASPVRLVPGSSCPPSMFGRTQEKIVRLQKIRPLLYGILKSWIYKLEEAVMPLL